MFEVMLSNNKERPRFLGTWINETNKLPTVLGDSHGILTKSRAYLFGGHTAGRNNIIRSAPLLEDGTIGSWITESNTLPHPLGNAMIVSTNTMVYLLGGDNGVKAINTVLSAPLGEDGTVGGWSVSTNSLPYALNFSQVVKTNTMVYLLGGHNGADHIDAIQRAPILEDGTLGSWVTDSNKMPERGGYANAVVIKNKAYLFGGVVGTSGINRVYSSPIDGLGKLGLWTIESNRLPETLYMSRVVTTATKIYLVGGYGINNLRTNKVYSADILENGNFGQWSIEANLLPSVLGNSQSIVTKSRVYMLGGYINDWTNNIYSASLI